MNPRILVWFVGFLGFNSWGHARNIDYSFTFTNLGTGIYDIGITDGLTIYEQSQIDDYGSEIISNIINVPDGTLLYAFVTDFNTGDPGEFYPLASYDPIVTGPGSTSFERDYYIGKPLDQYHETELVVGVKNYTEDDQTFSVYHGSRELLTGTISGGDTWEMFGGVYTLIEGDTPFIVRVSNGYMEVIHEPVPPAVSPINKSLKWAIAFTSEDQTPPSPSPSDGVSVSSTSTGYTIRETTTTPNGTTQTTSTNVRSSDVANSGVGQTEIDTVGGFIQVISPGSGTSENPTSTRTFTSNNEDGNTEALLQEIAQTTGQTADEAEQRRNASEGLRDSNWTGHRSSVEQAAQDAAQLANDAIGAAMPNNLGQGGEVFTIPEPSDSLSWELAFPDKDTGQLRGGTIDFNPFTTDLLDDVAPWAIDLHRLGYNGALWLAQYLFVSWIFANVRDSLHKVILTPSPTGSSVEAALASNPVSAAGAPPFQLIATAALVALIIAAISIIVAVYTSLDPIAAMSTTRAIIEGIIGSGTVADIVAYASLIFPLPGMLAISANYLVAQGLFLFAAPGAQMLVRVFRL